MKTLPRLLSSALVAATCACNSPFDDEEGDSFGGSVQPPVAISGGATGGGFATGFPGGAVGPSGRPLRLTDLRTAAVPPPTISGGTLAVAGDGKRAVAADPDRDAVYVLDLDSLSVRTLQLPPGSEPGRVALDRAGGAHVALRRTGKLARVDLASGELAKETSVCAQPRGVAYDAVRDEVVTSCMDGQLVSLQAASHSETGRRTLPQDLRDVVIAGGTRWVSRYRSAELLALEDANVKTTTRPNQSHSLSFNSLREPMQGVDPSRPIEPTPVTFSPTLAWRALPAQHGGVWMLHQRSQDGEVVVGAGGYGSGCQTITTGALTEFDDQGRPARTMPINLGGLSVDAAISPDQQWLAVASPGAYVRGQPSVQIYATAQLQAQEVPGPVCAAPMQTAGSENQTIAVTFDDKGLLYALSREPAELQIFELRSVAQVNGFSAMSVPALTRRASIALNLHSARDTGHDLFHADVGQGLACASCHGEALDDGHVWNFQKIGPRRTQNMRGGLLKTAPFHWDGDMGSIGHLVDDVMTGRMGGFPVEPSFAAALGTWIDQQPALSLPAQDEAAVARGKTVFESSDAKCASCHSGPNLTNNQSYDVGTGGNFQVPGLLGLALRAPFMHNGCAKTLEDRFETGCGGGDAHGKTSQLSGSQRADLVSYLNAL